ncbi:MAG TPA: nuclear transport factor 2 family protein, partial [Cyclobacteriaceae bacterium]|nr:nuclear transport factor 2 family protein [Cyclobacteriaceae bacterium]
MKFYLIIIIIIISLAAKAQSNDQSENPKEITRIILHDDSLFWAAYNVCDVNGMAAFLTDDLEFYHDKGGFTESKTSFIESVKKGMCGNPNWRMRREAIEGTVSVFPMNNIGAIITGEHVFYIQEAGKSEYL